MQNHFIYADNAATTKLDKCAYDAMQPYLLEEYGNASSLYSSARAPKKALKEARRIIAKAINAEEDEIYFTSGGTESDNWAIKGIATYGADKPSIITSVIEHHAILRACSFMEYKGYPVAYLPVSSYGVVEPSTLSQFITPDTRLVSVMYANNEIGTIQPIRKLVEIAHKNGSYFHTDAVQAVGHVPIDVKELDVDMLSSSAHKFNGPKGVGFLYIKNGTEILPFAHGGDQEKHLRAGTENISGIIAMSAALKNNIDFMDVNIALQTQLEASLLGQLKYAGVNFVLNGDAPKLPGLVSISINGIDGEAILHRMDLAGIAISTGSACNSMSTELSHVIKALHIPAKYANGTIRISFGKYNTPDDVNMIVTTLKKILRV